MRDTWAFAPSHLSLDCESHCYCCMVSAGCRRRKGRRLGRSYRRLGWSCQRPLCWREISATRQDPVKGGFRSARARVVTIEAVSMEARESPGDVTRSLANYLPLDRMRACFRYRGGGLTCHVLTRSGARGGQARGEKRIVRRNSINDDHVCFVCPPPRVLCASPRILMTCICYWPHLLASRVPYPGHAFPVACCRTAATRDICGVLEVHMYGDCWTDG